MADYAFLVAVAVFVLVAVIAFKILHGILRIVITLTALIAIVMGTLGFIVLMDANDLKANFGSSTNLFLLSGESEIISGLEIQGEETRIVNQQELEDYSEKLQKGDYASVKGDYYKLVVIDSAVLSTADADAARNAGYMEEKANYLLDARRMIFSDPISLTENYKSGKVIIYEETAVFKAIRVIPASLIKFAAKKFLDKTEKVYALAQ